MVLALVLLVAAAAVVAAISIRMFCGKRGVMLSIKNYNTKPSA